MIAQGLRLFVASLLFLAATVPAQQAPLAKSPSAPALASTQMAEVARLPLSFEANQGQADAAAKFVSRGPGYSLLLTDKSALLNLTRNDGTKEAPALSSSLLRIDLAGSDGKPQVEGVDPLPGKSNYLIGNDPKKWHTNVPTYGKVRYRGVYPGIDLVYYGNQRQLEYDFVVAPGRDPDRIALRFRGADKLEVSKTGELVVHAAGSELRLHRPNIYQQGKAGLEAIAGGYVLRADNTVGFKLGEYDRTRELVIDPTLSYATYWGGSSYDQAWAIAVDAQLPQDQALTSAYVAGYTCSSGMTTTAGVVKPTSSGCDAYVMKLRPAANTLMWATYLGGSSTEGAYGIAVDPGSANPNVYVAGHTCSVDFPVTNGSVQHGCSNAFYAKLNSLGTSLLFSTYLGGSGSDEARAIAVDAAGNAFIGGDTTSLDFPLLNNFYPPIQGGVYFSNDAGNLWSLLRNNPTIMAPYIRSLAVAPAYGGPPPTVPSIVYAGTENSGMWTSNNGGLTWARSNSGMTAGLVMAIVVDPLDPATIYAGSGQGVFKSTNSGGSWTALTSGLGNRYVQALAFDSSHNLYAGTSSGLYKLPNGTTSWGQVLMPITSWGGQPSISSIAISPTSPSTMFVGANDSPNGLYSTTDSGSTWTPGGFPNVQALVTDAGGTTLFIGTQHVVDGMNFILCGIPSMICSSGSDGLLNSSIGSIVVDAGGLIYAAGPFGVFQNVIADLGMVPWTLITNGMNNPYPGVNALAIDPANSANLYAGSSFQEGFVAAFAQDGTLTYSTPVGGDRYNHVRGIAVDSSDNAYITGYTNSPNFPVTTGAPYAGWNDAFLLKFEPAGIPLYSMLLGGTSEDYGYAIALDNQATPNVYMTGNTCSIADFPVTSSPTATGCSAFIAKANPNVDGLNLQFSTLFGGTTNSTNGNAIAVNSSTGNVWVTGQTWASDLVTTNASQPFFIGVWFNCGATTCPYSDAFVTQYDNTGALQFSTYLGGASDDVANGIAVDPFGNAYVAGYTTSQDFPVVPPAQQPNNAGGTDMFIAKFTTNTHSDDMSVALGGGAASVNSGTPISYTATVTNNGTDPLGGNNVVLTISPVGVNIQDSISLADQSRCHPVSLQSIRCALDTLAPGNSTSVSFTETPQQVGGVMLYVRAWVTSDDTDTNTANNTTQLLTTVTAGYGVDVQMSHPAGSVVAGSTVTETITVTNRYDNLSSATLTVNLPAGSTMANGTSGSCGGTTVVTCALPALAHQQVVSLPVVFTAPITATTYTYNASIVTNPASTVTATGTLSDSITVVAGADLAVSVSMNPLPNTGNGALTVVNGGTVNQVTFTTTVTNQGGPNAPTSVVLDNGLPAGLSYVSSNTTQGSCSAPSTVNGYTLISCNLGGLAVGGTAQVSITANIVQQTGYASAMVQVSSELGDPNGGNNKGFGRVQVLPTAQAVEHWFVADRVTSMLYPLDLNSINQSIQAGPGYSRASVLYEGQALYISPNARLAFLGTSVVDMSLAQPWGDWIEVARTGLTVGWDVAPSADGKQLVYPDGCDGVQLVNTATFMVTPTFMFNGLAGVGDDPSQTCDIYTGGVVVVGNIAYINTDGSAMGGPAGLPVLTLDLTTGAKGFIAGTAVNYGMGYQREIAATPDGKYVLALRSDYNATTPSLLIIDASTQTLVQNLALPSGSYPTSIVVPSDPGDPNGMYAYLLDYSQIIAVHVSPLNPIQVKATTPLTYSANPGFDSMAMSADGSTIYLANSYQGPNLSVANVAAVSTSSVKSGTVSWVIAPLHFNGYNNQPSVVQAIATGYVDPTPLTQAAGAPVITGLELPILVANDIGGTFTIDGSNFSCPDVRVRIGRLAAAPPTTCSATKLTVNLPPGTPSQDGHVIVTNSNPSASVLQQAKSAFLHDGGFIDVPASFQPAHQMVSFDGASNSVNILGRHVIQDCTAGTASERVGALSTDGKQLYLYSSSRVVALNVGSDTATVCNQTIITSDPRSYFNGITAGVNPNTHQPMMYLTEYTRANAQAGTQNGIHVVGIDADLSSVTVNQKIINIFVPLSGTVSNTISGIAVTPDGQYAYVPVFYGTTWSLMVVNLATSGVNEIPLLTWGTVVSLNRPYVTPDGKWLLAETATGSIAVISIFPYPATPTLSNTIAATPPSGYPAPFLETYEVSNGYLYATDGGGMYLYTQPGSAVIYSFDFSVPASPTQLNAYPVTGVPYLSHGMRLSYDGAQLYVPKPGANVNAIDVLDTARLRTPAANPFITSISTGLAPGAVWASPVAIASVDLAVSMTGPASAAPAQQITYTATVQNPSSTDTATNVFVFDSLPAGTSYVSNSGCVYDSTGVSLGCGSGTYMPVSNAVLVTDQLTIPPGGHLTLEVLVNVPASPGAITNTIQVGADQNDLVQSNNTASVTTNVGTGLVITTQSPLPAGLVGATYSQTLAASGGTPPYTWTVSNSSLPHLLNLDPSTGVISGTPDTPGTTTFTAMVTDSMTPTANTATAQLSITINAPVEITISPSFATLVTGGTQQFTTTVLNAGDTSVTWAVNGIAGGNSIVGTVSSGTYFAPVFPVTATVTATSVADPTKSAAALVQVIPQAQTTAAAWGMNAYGGLGNDTTTDSHMPIQVSGLTGVASLGGGYGFSAALINDGSLWSWGYNLYGQLGNDWNGPGSDFYTPQQVGNFWSGAGVVAVASGEDHGVALTNDGNVSAWGYNYYGQLGDGTNYDNAWPQVSNISGVVAIAAGGYNSLALKSDGTVWAWGANINGELGNGTTVDSNTPVQVSGLAGVVAIATGFNHSLAVKHDGTVWAWGWNQWGQLGNGTTTNSSTPVQVSGLAGVVAVAAGDAHSLALMSDGTVRAWGYNSDGELGNASTVNSSTPVQVSSLAGVVALASGSSHNLALKGNGTVWTWGFNSSGQLGNGASSASHVPVQVIGLSGVTAIAAGAYHSLAAITAPIVIPVDHFTVTTTAGAIEAGVPFNATVTAEDASYNTLTGYTGTVHFSLTSPDSGAVLPYDYQFTTADLGRHTFTNGVLLRAVGSQTIRVNDVAQPSKTGSLGVFVLTAPACTVPPSGLVSWWPAEGNANDINGGNNGTLTSAANFATGIVGQAFHFDGSPGTGVQVPNSTSLNPVNAITIDAWIKPSSFPNAYVTVARKDQDIYGNTQYSISVTDLGQAECNIGKFGIPIGGSIQLNSWQHVACTYDSQNVRLYVNGVEVASVAATQPIPGSTQNLGIGMQDGGSAREFAGLIDEVRIYSRALSAAEIQGIYAAGGSGVCQVPAPTLTSISPNSVVAGSGAFTLDLTGANFTNSSAVLWNGNPRVTTYISPTALQAAILAADLASTGSATVSVQNPAPGGGLSGTLPFSITAQPTADLILSATAPPVFNSSTGTYTYSVTVTNGLPASPSVTATNVVVTDTLSRYGYVSASGPGGPTQCSFNAGVVSCNIGSLAYLGQATVTVTVTPPTSGWASNWFHASGDQLDPDPANNSVNIGPVLEGVNTTLGANVAAFAADAATGSSVAVTFSNVTQAGNTTLTATSTGPAAPAGFRFGTPVVMYDLHTTATWNGSATVNLSYAGVTFHHPDKLRLLHQENGVWVDRTVAIDALHHVISAVVPSFSLFALVEPVNRAPVAMAKSAVAPGVSAAGASLKLDATGSSDADGDGLTYRWTGAFPEGGGTVTGATPSITLPLGASSVTLVVNDGETDSAPLSVPVTVSDFSLDLPVSSVSATRGQAVSLTVNIMPKYGSFDGPIALTCPELPAGSTCAFSSATVTPGARTATATLTLTIGAANASAALARRGGLYALWLGMLPFGLLLSGGMRRKRTWWLLLAVVLLLVATQFACGGGGGSNAPAPATQATTQTSTVTVTVSGTSGSLAHSSTATIVVH